MWIFWDLRSLHRCDGASLALCVTILSTSYKRLQSFCNKLTVVSLSGLHLLSRLAYKCVLAKPPCKRNPIEHNLSILLRPRNTSHSNYDIIAALLGTNRSTIATARLPLAEPNYQPLYGPSIFSSSLSLTISPSLSLFFSPFLCLFLPLALFFSLFLFLLLFFLALFFFLSHKPWHPNTHKYKFVPTSRAGTLIRVSLKIMKLVTRPRSEFMRELYLRRKSSLQTNFQRPLWTRLDH